MGATQQGWDGDAYQARFDALAAAGGHVHGEADLVMSLLDVPNDLPGGSTGPPRVLDAGCGTGRVAVELAARGVTVVGVDRDPAMLATARERAPELRWELADLSALHLEERFDLVVMAGNVPLFTPPGTHGAIVAGCAAHLHEGGLLVAGFQLRATYGLVDFDRHCDAAGLELVERFSTWARDPFDPTADDYAVSVHRRRGPSPGDRRGSGRDLASRPSAQN